MEQDFVCKFGEQTSGRLLALWDSHFVQKIFQYAATTRSNWRDYIPAKSELSPGKN